MAFDGTNIWLSGESFVIELRASDGAELGRWPSSGTAGIAFDGANIWVGEFNDNALGKL